MPARGRPHSPRRPAARRATSPAGRRKTRSPSSGPESRERPRSANRATPLRQGTIPVEVVVPSPPLEVPPAHDLAAVFRRLDARGRGVLSIGEVDRAVVELYGEQGRACRPALQRSFHAADAAGGGALGLAEFCLFFEYLVYFQANWATFEQIERTYSDGLTLESLIAACKQLGQPLQRAQALASFQLMAGSSALAGRVAMDSFCRWSAQWHVERSAERTAEPDVTSQPPATAQLIPAVGIDLDDTSVRTFGKNTAGQLGLGHWTATQPTPDQPIRLPRIDPPPPVPRLIKKVACGGRHTVVLSTAGELWSFGANDHGQLGMGIAQPVTTRELGVRDIACGDSFSMLIDGEGAIWGWGDNRCGQLGYPTLRRESHAKEEGAMNFALKPTKMSCSATGTGALPTVEILAAGHSHCAAISQQGGLWTWGWNENGQLGLEHLDTFHYMPQQVRGTLTGKICTAIGCGDRHTVVAAYDPSGETERGASLAYSFGSNSSGQLGIGKEKGDMGYIESVPIPQHVVFNPDLEFGLGKMTIHQSQAEPGSRPRPRSPAAVRRREQESFHEKGSYLGGGDYAGRGTRPNMQRLADHPSELGLSVVRIACGARHTLAVVEHTGTTADGGRRQPSRDLSVWSWGQNNKGQLGLAANDGVAAAGGCGNMSIPHRVVAVDRLSYGELSGAQVSCGQFTSYVAVRGAVYVWGNNHAGQLGVNTETHDSIHLTSKKQKDTDVAREISMADFTQASRDAAVSDPNPLLCVAAGGDHAAIWIDSFSSAIVADETRGSKPQPLRFVDCSLPKKCEIAVMSHDPVLLSNCIQEVVRDRSTAMMEKPLQQRIEHLQNAWGGAASGVEGAESSRVETFMLSLEAAQAAAAAAVEAEVPRATVRRSRSTNTPRAASPAPVRSVAARSSSRSTQRSTTSRATSPKPARRSPARASPAKRHQSPRRPTSMRGDEASNSSNSVARSTAASSAPLSTVPIQRVAALEEEVTTLKTEVAAMREDMIGLRGDVASMAQEIGRAIELMSRKA